MPRPSVKPEPSSSSGADTRLDDTMVGLSTRTVAEAEDEPLYLPGSKIGRYVVLEQVGRGGMGVVLAAFDPQLNRKIALKLLHAPRDRPRGSSRGGAASTRLLREAQAIAKLSHPNVISVYDVGTLGEGIYVAMEFVEGCTLTGWLEQRHRTSQQIVDMFLQAARGLAAAHAAGLVHRDFKPDNALVGLDGKLRVSDFGLARADPSQVGDDAAPADEVESSHGRSAHLNFDDSDVLSSPLTQAGVVVGTPRYMAPEQHAGAHADPRSDQFAFCVALYQALYGQDPYVAHSLKRLAQAKLQGDVCPVPHGSTVPDYLEDVIFRGLSPDPGDRFASMEDLVAALERDPAQWRHRIALVAVGLAVAATLGTGLVFGPDPARAACGSGNPAPWQGEWDLPRKASLQQTLIQADPEHGARRWAIVEAELDEFTARWEQMRSSTCGHRASPEVLADEGPVDLQLRCFDRQRTAALGVLDVLAEVDVDSVPRVVQTVALLPALEHCTNADFVLAQPAPPRDQATVVAVEDLRRRFARVAPMLALGQWEAAVQLSERLVEEAQTLDWPPLRAEAYYALGLASLHAGKHEQARSALSEAVWSAIRTKHDAYVAAAAAALVGASEHPDEATRWEEHARSVLARLGLEGLPLADLDAAAGALALRKGDLPRARTLVERAVAVRESVRGPDDPALVGWLVLLGDVLRVDGDAQAARRMYLRAIELADARLDDENPRRGLAVVGLGRLELERGDLQVARARFDEALQALRATARPDDPHIARVLAALASVDEREGDHARAHQRLEEARAIAGLTLPPGHPLLLELVTSLGRVQRELGDVGQARRSLEQSLAAARRFGGTGVVAEAAALRELAELHRVEGELDRAVRGFEEVLSLLERHEDVDRGATARARFGLARARWLRDRDPGARQDVERARAVLAAEGPRGALALAEVDRWLAQLRSSPAAKHRGLP